jgi:hypothetical protein
MAGIMVYTKKSSDRTVIATTIGKRVSAVSFDIL